MAAVGAVAFVVLAVVLVPWNPVPGGGPTTLPARDTILERPSSPAPTTTAARPAASAAARWSVSLAVTCWLGFTRAGLRLVGRLRGWWWVRVVLGVAAVNLVGRLVTLPFAVGRLPQAGVATGCRPRPGRTGCATWPCRGW